MRPWFVGVCTSALWGYASIQYGLMHPYFTGLWARTVRTYAPVFYSVTASGFAQCPVFTTLSGLPPEDFVLTSTRYVPAASSEGIYHHAPGGLVFGDDRRSSDSRSRFRNKEDALRLVFLVELQAASRKLHNTAADEKLIKSLELNSYGVRRADGHG